MFLLCRSFNCTYWNWNNCSKLGLYISKRLSIVLIGIEILNSHLCLIFWQNFQLYLLELKWFSHICYGYDFPPFNCTYWNWNSICVSRGFLFYLSFNCTYWNWNQIRNKLGPSGDKPFNCTYWNWNRKRMTDCASNWTLSIVLIGIEIHFPALLFIVVSLSIVLIGIEIKKGIRSPRIYFMLSIVLIGIEISTRYALPPFFLIFQLYLLELK